MRILNFALIAGLIAASASFAQERTVTIGIIGKSQSNPVFLAANKGAQDAAKELGKKHGVNVVIDLQTPPEEDARKQAEAVEALASKGVDGIAISCSDADTLTPAINAAVDAGIAVMTFDSDAPVSKKFYYYGVDDQTYGKIVIAELAKIMGNQGKIAILAGNKDAPNLRDRVKGAINEAKRHPGITIVETVHHEETPEKAAAAIQQTQDSHPEIQGWAILGGWPLSVDNAFNWQPGEIKVVSVFALLEHLKYLDSGHVQLLLAQDSHKWGYRSVQVLLEEILTGSFRQRYCIPTRVTKNNVKNFRAQWYKWMDQKP